MAVLLTPFLVLSVIGLVLSVIAHTAALIGLPQPLGPAAWGLHIGIFVVWLPAVIVSNRLVGDFKRKDFWKAALRGCPDWMRCLTYGFFGYAVVNFLLFMAAAPPKGAGGGANAPPEVFRGFSGHWMAFYSAAAAILYSALAVSRSDPARRCPNGHPVPPSASFCEACGASIAEQDAAGPWSADAEPGAAPDRG
ncbi:zinc ribbon domain-containing protein [Gemmata sp. JC717]|uniref:zinc ribbon domain-containing protein n=1 Tax=Gemmata algarum TaxID=2975278 RepID=UPI0021BADFCB|nr:zinc ribbon domain-containing protein [Gemmata algarum]MDY3555563.1 zinc ribbon domain-containing protein [Gemmata algarum]